VAVQGIISQPNVAETETSTRNSWVAEIPPRRRRHLRIWLWTGAALTAGTLFVGGVTRLTESGLSIVDWDPIMGVIPPLTDDAWDQAFARYQQFPEYQVARPNMTMGEFQFIFFWEYLHRMLGRFLGVVFLLPFLWFWIRGYFNAPLMRRALLLFGLGGLQGLMGWYMVQSGLVDEPDVSHLRLGAHLVLAVTIFSFCIWFANDLLDRAPQRIASSTRTWLRRSLIGLGALLGTQIFWGALVAGLKAGFIYPTFPLMDGSLLPPDGWRMDPAIVNLIDNMVTVQWFHRVLATVLLAAAIALYIKVRSSVENARFQRLSAALLVLISLQYALGVATLLTHVRIDLAVTHQVHALVIVAVLLTFLHQVLNSGPVPVTSRSPR
jgi:heme a synthase